MSHLIYNPLNYSYVKIFFILYLLMLYPCQLKSDIDFNLDEVY